MPRDLTIRQAQQLVAEYLTAKGEPWTKLRNRYFLITHLVEEVGELARGTINVKAREPRRRGVKRSPQVKLALIRDSLGDLLYHLCKIAVAYNIDLQEVFRGAMRTIRTRYPAEAL